MSAASAHRRRTLTAPARSLHAIAQAQWPASNPTHDGHTCERKAPCHSSSDYDTFAGDLKALLDHLALDQDVVLAGFSMGTGEVTRYLGAYGSAGVSKAMLLGVIPPFLLQTEDNPKSVPGSVFEDIKRAIVTDRYAYFDDSTCRHWSSTAPRTESCPSRRRPRESETRT